MDLLATVRKEGSRGGRGEFKWTDVQNSSHRENYLGHSIMAPVGRWQKGRDLNWYAKGDAGDDAEAVEKAAMERKEELRRVKEAEQDAMAKALGLPVPDRNNANLQEMSNKREFDQTLKDALKEADEAGGRGVGFDGARHDKRNTQVLGERIEGNAEAQDKELEYALKEYKRRHGDKDRRKRSRSRDRDRNRDSRRVDKIRESRGERRHDHSSHTRERHRRRHSRSRSRSRSRSKDRHRPESRRERSRSPRRREDHQSERRRRHD